MKHFFKKNISFITILAFLFCLYFLFAPEKCKFDPLFQNKKGRLLSNKILKNNIFILKKSVYIFFYPFLQNLLTQG
jgi:hypothetical protein